jgi:hypothetical protein
MSKRIENITDEYNQRHVITTDFGEISLSLNYSTITKSWSISVVYGTTGIYGKRIALNVPTFLEQNLPFDFVCLDSSGQEVEPFLKNDFSSERCKLYLLEPEDVRQIRGFSVPL